jgi:hypothetical protein
MFSIATNPPSYYTWRSRDSSQYLLAGVSLTEAWLLRFNSTGDLLDRTTICLPRPIELTDSPSTYEAVMNELLARVQLDRPAGSGENIRVRPFEIDGVSLRQYTQTVAPGEIPAVCMLTLDQEYLLAEDGGRT